MIIRLSANAMQGITAKPFGMQISRRMPTQHLSTRRPSSNRSAACQAGLVYSAATPEADFVEVELKVEGLECGKCSSRVHDALLELDIVKEANVSYEEGRAILQVDAPSLFDAWNELPRIMETIDSLGFTAQPCLGDKEE